MQPTPGIHFDDIHFDAFHDIDFAPVGDSVDNSRFRYHVSFPFVQWPKTLPQFKNNEKGMRMIAQPSREASPSNAR